MHMQRVRDRHWAGFFWRLERRDAVCHDTRRKLESGQGKAIVSKVVTQEIEGTISLHIRKDNANAMLSNLFQTPPPNAT